MASYATRTDLEMSVGGAANLVQLLDKNDEGAADPQLVATVLARASAEADSALQVRHQLPLAAPYPPVLSAHVSAIAAYYAHQLGSDGQGVPQGVRQRYEDALSWLDHLAAGTRSLGVPAKVTTEQTVAQVEINPSGGRVTRNSLRGLW